MNTQMKVICPNCHSEALIGMRRSVSIALATLIILLGLSGLLIAIQGSGTDREFGFILLAYSIFMWLIYYAIVLKVKAKKVVCKTCKGIVRAERGTGADNEQKWLTTFIETPASKLYTNEQVQTHTEAVNDSRSDSSSGAVRHIQIWGGVIIFAIGVNIPDIIDLPGDWEMIIKYGLMVIGASTAGGGFLSSKSG